MLIDYHVHTRMSDGSGIYKDYIEQAIKLGICELGFSDHLCIKGTAWSIAYANLPKYVKEINEIRNIRNEREISIKLGLECDFFPSEKDRILEILNRHPFDYVIGSVHFLDDWCIDCDNEVDRWEGKDEDEVYKQYFRVLKQMIDSKIFDIIGHIDVIKKYGFRPKKDITGILNETLELIAKSGIAIEINTSGLRRPCEEMYPSKELLEMCFDYQIPITLGSDAHAPDQVGMNFKDAVDLAKDVGYKTITSFTKRRITALDL